jgi:DNA-directed RNA polymerase specialized sigma24 family protein
MASGLTFEEFASAHLAALLRFATALTNDRELAADLVQDVLLRAHERWAHVRFSDGSGSICQTDDRQ